MAVLERSDLEASPLADLHAIADQLGLDGFRRLRKPELIDTILAHGDGDAAPDADGRGERADESSGDDREARAASARPRRRGGRLARVRARRSEATEHAEEAEEAEVESEQDAREEEGAPDTLRGRSAAVAPHAEGVVEVLGNGSGFLRVSPPEPSDEDVYISAAQVRRCELVSGDRVSGPVRTPRRSERYPSLVRIDTINGAPADTVASGVRYEDLPAAYPSERIPIGVSDPTLEAIEWLTPLGRGSRALIVGPSRSGKTETLRSLAAALAQREDLELTLLLLGARPEEISAWQDGPLPPASALTFAASADAQAQALEQALDAARRLAARGGNALLLLDSLDGLHPSAARKALAAARNLRDAGSLTLIATASAPLGGETTVIALDLALTATGRKPILDLAASGTLRPELLVGEDGARAIMQAQASAQEAGG